MIARGIVLAVVLALGLVGSGDGVPSASGWELRDPVWSPDGTSLAYVRTTAGVGQIFVVGFDGRSRRALTVTRPPAYGLSWSPDGSSVAYASGGDIWRVGVQDGRVVRLTASPSSGAFQPAWSPAGATIAYTVFEGCFRCTRIYGIDALDGGNRQLLAEGPRRPAWSRDGALLLTSQPVSLVTVATGQSRLIDGSGSYASWSGDHTRFVYSGSLGVYVSSPDSTVAPRLAWPSRYVYAHPELSPFAVQLAAVRGRSVVLGRLLRGPRVTLPRSDSADDAPAWSFRGQLAYVADGVCGARSEIDVARSDGSKPHTLVRAC